MDATLVILLDITPLQSRPQATDITCGVPKGFAPHFLRRVGAHQDTGEIPLFSVRDSVDTFLVEPTVRLVCQVGRALAFSQVLPLNNVVPAGFLGRQTGRPKN